MIQCSFCGKERGECKKLIAGLAEVYICEECIKLCLDILIIESFKACQKLEQSNKNIIAINEELIRNTFYEFYGTD